jgi:hypothetical protein
MELLSAVKSAGNLAASIFLKPFCFEGQRRQVEVNNVCSSFFSFHEQWTLWGAGCLKDSNNLLLICAVRRQLIWLASFEHAQTFTLVTHFLAYLLHHVLTFCNMEWESKRMTQKLFSLCSTWALHGFLLYGPKDFDVALVVLMLPVNGF